MDVAAEHDLIDLCGGDDETFHENAEHQADRGADHRQQDGFTEDVRIHLARGEAEHFERGDLAGAFGDVDVREVVQHHERQQRRCDHKHHHHAVDRLEHSAIAADGLIAIGDGFHAIHGKQLVGERGTIHAFPKVGIHGGEIRRFSHGPLVHIGGDIGVLRHIVLHDAGDGHRVPVSYQVADVVLVIERQRIAR